MRGDNPCVLPPIRPSRKMQPDPTPPHRPTRPTSLGALTPRLPSRAPARALPPAMEARKWKPGQSGNPTGKSGQYLECMRICREASPEAARKMVALMDSEDPRVAYMATNTILERAWGKPKEFEPNAEREPAPLDFSRLTTEQRQQMRELLEAMKATAAMPDGDAESARE